MSLIRNLPASAAFIAAVLSAHPSAAMDIPAGAPGKSAAFMAIDRAIVPLAKSIDVYPTRVSCFSCHHQGAPGLALKLAVAMGHSSAEGPLKKVLDFTKIDLQRDIKMYTEGDGQAGGVSRAGYAMLALGASSEPRSAVTDAVSAFILRRDAPQPFWKARSNRPPSEFSSFTDTALAIKALLKYGDKDKEDVVKARIKSAAEWLVSTAPKENEDRVWRLIGLYDAGVTDHRLKDAAKDLLNLQQQDGGWSQLDGGKEDVYASATAAYALLYSGVCKKSDDAIQKAAKYLLAAQLPDGTWHVATRAKPVQPYFESGFPHIKDQFISVTATAWCIAALSYLD